MTHVNKFSAWIVAQGGPPRVARLLDVSGHAVRIWSRGQGTPKIKTLVKIMALSGLSFHDVVSLRKVVRKSSKRSS